MVFSTRRYGVLLGAVVLAGVLGAPQVAHTGDSLRERLQERVNYATETARKAQEEAASNKKLLDLLSAASHGDAASKRAALKALYAAVAQNKLTLSDLSEPIAAFVTSDRDARAVIASLSPLEVKVFLLDAPTDNAAHNERPPGPPTTYVQAMLDNARDTIGVRLHELGITISPDKPKMVLEVSVKFSTGGPVMNTQMKSMRVVGYTRLITAEGPVLATWNDSTAGVHIDETTGDAQAIEKLIDQVVGHVNELVMKRIETLL
jgi:hypothetical protein